MGDRGVITDITKFATHDGPGIRTTVFVKGCPLQCSWCSNPETQELNPQLYFIAKKCKECGECEKACPSYAISCDKNNKVDRQSCMLCMDCVEVCPYDAFKKIGREVTVREIMQEVENDKPFYGTSGGITLSGGEPLFRQARFTINLLKTCYERGISTVLDTSGYAVSETVEEVLKYTGLVLLDIKHMDPDEHRAGTGVSNEVILENAKLMCRKTEVRISLPLIPGFNNSELNIRETAQFAKNLGVEWLDLNPLHTLGSGKYQYLGLESPYSKIKAISKEEIVEVKKVIESYGLKTTIGRMM